MRMPPFPLIALSVWLLPWGVVAGDLVVRAGRPVSGEPVSACDAARQTCAFSDTRQENRYSVTDRVLSRVLEGRTVYAVPIAGGALRARLVTMNRQRTQLAIVLAQEAVATGAMFSPGAFAPEAVQRQYTLSIRNPKSGEQIKAIDLGMLKPDGLSLSPAGDYAWVTGEELQLRRREVRAYNTRGGTLEHMTPLARNAEARLYEDGFAAGGVFYAVESGGAAVGTPRRHLSANPYSIAEFSVRVASPIALDTFRSQPIAVVAFEGADGDVREMLESSLAVKLGTAGLQIVERKRIKELLQEAQFQNLGITDSKSASELGRMANARYLAFGTVRATGSVTFITLRLTGVEDGTVHASVELECRDCTPDDYVQGVGFLVNDWITTRPN